jgi:hypothetical protein
MKNTKGQGKIQSIPSEKQELSYNLENAKREDRSLFILHP